MIIICPAFQTDIRNQIHFFRNVVITFIAVNILVREEVALNHFTGELEALGDEFIAKLMAHTLARLARKQRRQLLDHLVAQFSQLFAVAILQCIQFFLRLGTQIFVALRPGKQLGVDDYPFQGGRRFHGSILHVTGFVAEDGPQQFFFRGRVSFSFRRYFADQDIPFLYFRTDPDDAVLVEVFHGFLTDIRYFRCKLLFAAFRVAYFQFKFFHVNGSINIIAHDPFGNDDSILKIISLPGHVCHQ